MNSAQNTGKQAAAQAALEFVTDGSIVGVGTGSTVNLFIDALATRRDRLRGAVSSSEASTARLQAAGIEVFDLNATGDLERLRRRRGRGDPPRPSDQGGRRRADPREDRRRRIAPLRLHRRRLEDGRRARPFPAADRGDPDGPLLRRPRDCVKRGGQPVWRESLRHRQRQSDPRRARAVDPRAGRDGARAEPAGRRGHRRPVRRSPGGRRADRPPCGRREDRSLDARRRRIRPARTRMARGEATPRDARAFAFDGAHSRSWRRERPGDAGARRRGERRRDGTQRHADRTPVESEACDPRLPTGDGIDRIGTADAGRRRHAHGAHAPPRRCAVARATPTVSAGNASIATATPRQETRVASPG